MECLCQPKRARPFDAVTARAHKSPSRADSKAEEVTVAGRSVVWINTNRRVLAHAVLLLSVLVAHPRSSGFPALTVATGSTGTQRAPCAVPIAIML